MKPRTPFPNLIVFAIAALLVLLPHASQVAAQGSAPLAGTISYSGSLSDDAGQPVTDGAYTFHFALYSAVQEETLLWSETQAGVVVKGGAFTALLGSVTPLPKEARLNQGWLQVSVRGPGEADFTALAPRLALDTAVATMPSSPATGLTCAHDHFGETWTGSSTGGMHYGLEIYNTYSGGVGIKGRSNLIGVEGESDYGVGIQGTSGFGTGVMGGSMAGFAMDANGNTTQDPQYGGWVKAMALTSGSTITRCFNSQTTGASVHTAPCGFSSSGSSGTWTVDFGFQVNDRYISVAPYWGGSGVPSAVIDSFPTANQVKVRLSADSAFFIIVY